MAGTSARGAEPPVLLRAFHPTDEAGVVAVLDATFHSTWAPQLTPAALEARLRDPPGPRYVRERGAEFVVAVDGDAVVGMVHWDGDFVHALHVRPAAQRRGVGHALLSRAEAAIAAAGHSSARLETDTFNTQSRAFYAARGYREIDSYPDHEWDSGLTTLLLAKALG